METPPDLRASTRARLAFLCLFVFVVALSVGAYFIAGLGKLQPGNTAHETRATLPERPTTPPGTAAPKPIDEAPRRNPQNKLLQMIATATTAADETSASADKLWGEVEPPALSKNIDLGSASRGDLEALGRGLKTAEANATALMPRYAVLAKTERDKVEANALSLRAEKEVVGKFMAGVDRQQANATALNSRLSSARADYYRAYQGYVAVLIAEFGAYKVVDGQFIFPLQRSVDRYNVAAHAMSVATRQVAELEAERKQLKQSQQKGWEQLANSK